MVKLELGAIGIGYATVITFTNNFILTLILALCTPEVRKILAWPTRAVWRDWGTYLKLGFFTMIIVCSEWWAFEIATIFSGLIGIKELGAWTIISTITFAFFMIPLGFQ